MKYLLFKGTVSREVKWVLLYVNQKLFSRAGDGHHKILILLTEDFSSFKNVSAHVLGSNGTSIFSG